MDDQQQGDEPDDPDRVPAKFVVDDVVSIPDDPRIVPNLAGGLERDPMLGEV
jgi:hypothetical protein